MSLPASQPASGLASSLGKRMWTVSTSNPSVSLRIWLITSSGAASLPRLLTPRPNDDSGFMSTYLAPISMANLHRSANSPSRVSELGVDSSPCSSPASANFRVVSTVVSNDLVLPRNLPCDCARKPSKLTLMCTPSFARNSICSSVARVAFEQTPTDRPQSTVNLQMARRLG